MKNMELPFIKDMFDSIAPKYDLLNRLLSLRQDVTWRKKMVSAMNIPENGYALDIACGTGDVALEILKQKGMAINILGVDFSPEMLKLANEKIKRMNQDACIDLLAGNALHLPIKENICDAITIAFGIRNISDKLGALKEFHGKLKNGGSLLVLELTTPESNFLLTLYLFYFNKILPLIGRLVSKNDMAYKYLPASVAGFPNVKKFVSLLQQAGFSDVTWKKLSLGIATLYVGYKR